MQNGIPTMILNVETGECWPEEQPSVPCDCRNKALECSIYANSSYCYTRSKGWKIPKEHSNLGSNYPAFSAVNSSLATREQTFHPTWTYETSTSSNTSTIVATFPAVGKLPSLFRKRKSSPPRELAPKEIRKCTRNETKCFPEGRERLLLAGHLLFALILLLSPLLSPFFTFFLRVGKFCHYRCHSANEKVSLLKLNKGGVRSFSLDFMRIYLCRICREEFYMEIGQRVHSSLKTKSSNSNHIAYTES